MGLAVNEGKTKYMLSTSADVPRMGFQIMANSQNFDVVTDVSQEIKRRVTLVNSFGLNRQLSSKDLSRATKLTLFKALILPVLLYGAETR